MKRVIFLVFVLTSYIGVNSQSFAPVGAEWHYQERFAFAGDIDYINFLSTKDTIIAEQQCRKIIKRHRIDCLDRTQIEFLYSANDSVYFYDSDSDKFILLYDFSAQKGDSWIVYTSNSEGVPVNLMVHVDSVTTTKINELDLKTLIVTYSQEVDLPYNYQSRIIERIGDTEYMFNWQWWYAPTCDANYSAGLSCYQDEALGLYNSGISAACNYISTVNNDKLVSSNLILYPNPFKDQFNLSTDSNEELRVEIYNLRGELLLSETFISQVTINLENESDGSYIAVIKSNDLILRTLLFEKITNS